MDENGETLARAKGGKGALSLGVDTTVQTINALWRQLTNSPELEQIKKKRTIICAGIAGFGLPGRIDQLAERVGDFNTSIFAADGYIALLGATSGKPGSLISIGTGVGAMRLYEDGSSQAVSGWGFPAGDHGSGAWLGLKVFADYLKFLDGISTGNGFNIARFLPVLEMCGTNAAEVMHWQRTARPADYGKLAPVIVANAAKDDPYCVKLLRDAAGKIGRIAFALLDHPKTSITGRPIYLSGGLSKTLLPLCREQFNNLDWRLSEAMPLDGAYLLATGRAPVQSLRTRPGFDLSDEQIS